MKCLIDSSAVILVLKWLKEKSVEALNGQATLNLAYYEINNVVWKQCAIEGSINFQEAIDRAKEVAQILEIMSIEELRSPEEVGEAMKYAVEQGLTFYDASYLQKAKSKNYVLVTEDKELFKKSEYVGVKAITVKEFLNLIKL
ncbi:MAG: type II toxin-antitoxin system VapC family toxin [Candidatus Bathyarchaeia archaeon]